MGRILSIYRRIILILFIKMNTGIVTIPMRLSKYKVYLAQVGRLYPRRYLKAKWIIDGAIVSPVYSQICNKCSCMRSWDDDYRYMDEFF
jgi:hypothetical protein